MTTVWCSTSCNTMSILTCSFSAFNVATYTFLHLLQCSHCSVLLQHLCCNTYWCNILYLFPLLVATLSPLAYPVCYDCCWCNTQHLSEMLQRCIYPHFSSSFASNIRLECCNTRLRSVATPCLIPPPPICPACLQYWMLQYIPYLFPLLPIFEDTDCCWCNTQHLPNSEVLQHHVYPHFPSLLQH